jgi:4-deoxy-L-threo-5-hexosulose-uronate ketol-isomerase
MKTFDTETIRKHLLIERLFEKGRINMVYSHVDRIIAGAACG